MKMPGLAWLSPARLSGAWDRLRTSYWFMPSVFALLAAAASVLMLRLDYASAGSLPVDAWWLYGGDADGARALMATIVGTMITVVSVVFSITMVTLTLASAQFGSRLLRMFMRDRGNQIVLALFIATFVYSLLVLRSVRGTEDVQFVPYLSVTLAVVLVLSSVGLLIYFIHHVSMSIQADHVVATVAAEVNAALDRLYPEQLGDAPEEAAVQGRDVQSARMSGEARAVFMDGEGYLQTLDADLLMGLACAHDLVLELPARPGTFVTEAEPLMLAWPRERVSREVEEALRQAAVLGRNRTLTQDAEHGVEQLVEIAVRALSPGINDPFTAVSCLDRLGALLCRLASKRFPSPRRFDEDGRLRVVADVPSFADFVDGALNLVRDNAGSSPAVVFRLLELIERLAHAVRRPEDRAVLHRHARFVHEVGREGMAGEHRLRELDERYQAVRVALDGESAPRRLAPRA